jgi:hypothetical protein
MNLGFVVLAHDHPRQVTRLVDQLTAQGAAVALHWDARHPVGLGEQLRKQLPANQAERVVSAERVAVRWGMWEVVEATINALRAFQRSGLPLDYVTLLSGHDYPLRPLSQLADYLTARHGTEHIESVDHEKEKWITDGLHDERWQYRHYVSWGTHPKVFDKCWHLQRSLGLKRKPPAGIKPHFGSQWWTLSWHNLQRILELSRRPDIMSFFRTTWVPDEMFFQTLLAAAAPSAKTSGTGLTLYHFARNGIPLVFYEDHYHLLAAQPFFFARKISPWSDRLRDKLDGLIDARKHETGAGLVVKKSMAVHDYAHTRSGLHLSEAKVFGRQRDPLWGDLSANKRPYIAIIGDQKSDFAPVMAKIQAGENATCYRELFRPDTIDYGPLAPEHPLYPADAPALRDQSRPNFLYDLIQNNPASKVAFCLRVPRDNSMAGLATADPLCRIVISPSHHDAHSQAELEEIARVAELCPGRLQKTATFDPLPVKPLGQPGKETRAYLAGRAAATACPPPS